MEPSGRKSPGSQPPTDKLFTEQQRETQNGIYHYNARLYNADIGRMSQADSTVPERLNPASYNRYSYLENNPVVHTDPTGHPQSPFWQVWTFS